MLTSYQGKWFRAWCKDIKGKGYDTQTWHIQATECGVSIWSTYLVTFCFSEKLKCHPPLQLSTNGTFRSCQNPIRTYELKPSKYIPISLMKTSSHHIHNNFVGTLYGHPVYHWNGPFSSLEAHTWILVLELGILRVQLD